MNESTSPEAWHLHPRLLADSIPIIEYDGILYRLMNDRRFVWVLVVPMQPGAEQIHRLPDAVRERTRRGIDAVCDALDGIHAPDRINVAAIGNVVPQLHVHCVARRTDDPAWPGVVWGAGDREPAAPLELLTLVRPLAAGLADRLGRHS
jgi:diadenosine tetraphosphate (Ap4A) HIT family hydrolase